MKEKKLFMMIVCLVVMAALQTAYAHDEYIDSSATLFDKTSKQYGAYSVIDGEIVYQDDDDEFFTMSRHAMW